MSNSILHKRYFVSCVKCDYRTRSYETVTEARDEFSTHEHRTTCGECGGPYDEDRDAWGRCGTCWAAAE